MRIKTLILLLLSGCEIGAQTPGIYGWVWHNDTLFYKKSDNDSVQMNLLQILALSGGATNEVLKKNSSGNYDWVWSTVAGAGDLLAANNLSDVASVATARSNLGLVIGTNVLAPNGSAAALTSFPTFNQNTTGTAAGWTTGRTLAITGDLAYTSPAFNGTANVTAAGTLATVNSNVGSFGSATQAGTFTVNAKGLITAASNTTIAIPQSAVTNLTTDLAAKQPLDADLTTIAGLTSTTDNFMVAVASAWASRTVAQVKTTLALDAVTNESKATMFTNPAFTGTPTGIGIPVYSRVTGSSATTTGQALVNITGLSNALTTNATYEFEAVLSVSTSAVTTGTAYGVNYSVAGGTIESHITGASTSTASKTLRINAFNTATTLYLATSAQSGGILIKGIITTGANAGNLTISHLKLTSGTSTVFINSYLKTTRIL